MKNQVMVEKEVSKSRKKHGKKFEARSVSDILTSVLEPILARRAGMTLALIETWPEIAGEEFRNTTRPEKINWPRKVNEDDPFKPAALIVACEPSAALFFQHETGVVVERVNVFFGFEAISQIRIVQKQVKPDNDLHTSEHRPLSEVDKSRLKELLKEIEDPELRKTLEKLGHGVFTKKHGR